MNQRHVLTGSMHPGGGTEDRQHFTVVGFDKSELPINSTAVEGL